MRRAGACRLPGLTSQLLPVAARGADVARASPAQISAGNSGMICVHPGTCLIYVHAARAAGLPTCVGHTGTGSHQRDTARARDCLLSLDGWDIGTAQPSGGFVFLFCCGETSICICATWFEKGFDVGSAA